MTGFFSSGGSCTKYINCQSNGNGSNGFQVDTGTSFILDQCSTCSNTNGFYLANAGVCCVVAQCLAVNNSGFGFIGNANVNFYQNIATCNGTNFDNFSASSAFSGKLDSKIDTLNNCCSTVNLCCSTVNSKIDSLTKIVVSDFAQTFTVLADIRREETTIESKLDRCCETLNSKIDILITDDSCHAIPIFGQTTISTSGSYCLANNINASGTAAITITANDVTLDLNGQTISGSLTNGILVTGSNIAIKDGLLDGILAGGTGINVSSSNNVTIQNIIAMAWGTGININNSNNIMVNNCICNNTTMNGFGMNINGSNDIMVNNCTCNDNNAGFNVSNGSRLTFTNCQSNRSGFNGVNLTNITSCIFDSCTTTSNTASGIATTNISDVEFTNCQSNGNSFGCFFGTLSSSVLNSCSADSNSMTGFFSSGGSCTKYINCQSNGNGSNGFQVDTGTSFILDQCSTCSNTNGFYLANAGVCCVVAQCLAVNNSGFGFIGNANVNFYQNIATCNGTNFDNFSASSAFSGKLDSKIDTLNNCCSTVNLCCSTVNSKIDFLDTTVVKDFAGTFTAIAANALCNLTPITGPTMISTSGSYCLANDITGAITISVNDVSIDLNGYTINANSGNGISIMNNGIITIQNGKIINANIGINCTTAADVLLKDLQIYLQNNGNGIEVNTCTNVEIDKCIITINSVSGNGISIAGSNYVTVRSCTAIGNAVGFAVVLLASSPISCLFEDCIAMNCNDGFFLQSNNSTICKNCCAELCTNGFTLLNSTKCLLSGCKAVNNSNDGFDTSLALSGNVIEQCTATANGNIGFLGAGSTSDAPVFYLNNAANNGSLNYSNIFQPFSAPILPFASTIYGCNLQKF